MGRIVSNFFITLDHVVESPNLFIFPYFNAQVGAAIDAGTAKATAFLMGRRLYDEWSQWWPTSTDEPFASMINGIDKYVVSDTLTDPTWAHSQVLGGDDLAGQVQRLKDSTDGDIAVSGSATTVRWLVAHGLVDELHLLLAPVAVGAGARLFDGRVPLRLVSSEAFDTGVLHLVYAPEPAAG